MCPLCKLKRLTHWYYEDDICTVVDCLTCGKGRPMIVLRRHTMSPTVEEEIHLIETISRLFDGCHIRREQKQVKHHLHWHIIKGE